MGLVSGAEWTRSALDLGTHTGQPPDVDVAVVRYAGDHVLSGEKLEINDFERVATQERLFLSGAMDDAHHATCQNKRAAVGPREPDCAVDGKRAPRMA